MHKACQRLASLSLSLRTNWNEKVSKGSNEWAEGCQKEREESQKKAKGKQKAAKGTKR